jgi:hypothetical protein
MHNGMNITSKIDKITNYLDGIEYVSINAVENAINAVKLPTKFVIKYEVEYEGEKSFITRIVNLKLKKIDTSN